MGLVFCGRQSPGGHNVISGLYDALKSHNAENCLVGFIGELVSFPSVKGLYCSELVLNMEIKLLDDIDSLNVNL